MAIDFLYPQYEVVRNYDRCIACRACLSLIHISFFFHPDYTVGLGVPPSHASAGKASARGLYRR